MYSLFYVNFFNLFNRDKKNCFKSKDYLVDTIHYLLNIYSIDKIHLICHSMGARILFKAIPGILL